MKYNKIKHIIGSLVLALTVQTSVAQNVARIGYFMDNSTHKHLMNPALVPARGYFSLGVGSVDLDLRSNLGYTNFIFPGLNESDSLLTFMHENVTPEQFLSKLSPENYLKLNQRMSLFSIGFYTGTSFWTLEVASRINANVNIPYDFFAFLKQGMSSPSGNRYEINNLSVSADMLAEVSLGSSFRITDDIRVGVKGKILGGGAKIKVGIDQMIIDMKPENWTVTTNGLVNLYGPGLEFVNDENGVINNFNFATPNNLAGMGYALDLGASWRPLKFLEVSAGVIDLGSVTWNKTYNKVARSSGTITYSGFDNISMGGTDGGSSSTDDQMNELKDGLMEMAQFKEVDESDNLKEKLTPTINAGVEAGVLNNKITLGLLYSNRLVPNNNISEITGVLNLKPFTSFNVAASYSLLNGVQNTFGLALGINLAILNIFVACDYVPMYVTPQYIPLNEATTHLQIGASISLWKMRKR